MIFCREQNSEKMYTIQDESNEEVFVYRIFKEADAKAILYLVSQAYDIGIEDVRVTLEKLL